MTGSTAILAGKTVLVVEDDSSLSPLLRLLVEDAGASVRLAEEPTEALRIAKELKQIDVLVSDVVLPSRSGFQLAEEIAGLHPETRVLFISGFGDPEIGARDLVMPFDTLLKPFLPEDFIAKIVALTARKG
jgi:two-component system, cell cycle sensor histidine kinase and response regulator CckA